MHVRNTLPPERGNWATYVATVRERVGMSKAELARRLGIDRGTVHRWETGKNRPEDPAVVQAFAELFGLDVDEALIAAGLRLGATTVRTPTSEPPLDPDLKIIMRRLTDPNVSEAEKISIRATLRYLADIAERGSGEGRHREAS